ncbi:hypothetical protein [Kordiimonas aquimaris]|nr:hypothetical protein [Kordiimonas aquimaris]
MAVAWRYSNIMGVLLRDHKFATLVPMFEAFEKWRFIAVYVVFDV